MELYFENVLFEVSRRLVSEMPQKFSGSKQPQLPLSGAKLEDPPPLLLSFFGPNWSTVSSLAFDPLSTFFVGQLGLRNHLQ